MTFAQDITEALPALRRYAAKLVRGDRERQADLVQDCLVRGLAHQSLFEAGTNAKSWLLRIMHNLSIDGARSGAQRPPVLPIDGQANSLPVRSNAEACAMVGEVARAIAALPENYRAALMAAADGSTYPEIAEALHINHNAVSNRLWRSRMALRAALGEEP